MEHDQHAVIDGRGCIISRLKNVEQSANAIERAVAKPCAHVSLNTTCRRAARFNDDQLAGVERNDGQQRAQDAQQAWPSVSGGASLPDEPSRLV